MTWIIYDRLYVGNSNQMKEVKAILAYQQCWTKKTKQKLENW